MSSLVEQVDKILVDLAWSLWSELGVAGINRQHKIVLSDEMLAAELAAKENLLLMMLKKRSSV